jgi:hypothetical protein
MKLALCLAGAALMLVSNLMCSDYNVVRFIGLSLGQAGLLLLLDNLFSLGKPEK